MTVSKVLQNKLTLNQNLPPRNTNEIQSQSSPAYAIGVPEIAISLTPIGLIFSWIVFFIMLRKIRTILEDKMVISVRGSHRLPCQKCKFYSNNHYLKCAVNPGIVMTEEAKECSDYSPEKEKKNSHKNIFPS
ncbi:hypothetical protein CLI64_01695 [Nostoc sp. CENA543]|uniref:hypothetical protein n=1 Tax=Nostoc sp. CENA543 TaxID=1869241 RepID=UPI000CA1B623|nr:hypothetical protein [Nostoc sp. CENA543]AUS99208.1 hypothetical protein CLI64_01695 [Nostoc sp. CENA543]